MYCVSGLRGILASLCERLVFKVSKAFVSREMQELPALNLPPYQRDGPSALQPPSCPSSYPHHHTHIFTSLSSHPHYYTPIITTPSLYPSKLNHHTPVTPSSNPYHTPVIPQSSYPHHTPNVIPKPYLHHTLVIIPPSYPSHHTLAIIA